MGIEALAGVTAIETTVAAVPVPLKLTTCGLPPPSSLNSNDAVRVPTAVGVKVMLTVQLAPAASVLPQVLVWEKSLASAPVIAICERRIVLRPLLVMVTV